MKKRFLYLILPLITLILEILPYGAVCRFANPEGEPWRKTYSYFSLLPFGYANFAPLLTAMMTCIITVLLLVYVFVDRRRIVHTVKAFLAISVVLSLCPLLLGIHYFSAVGGLITLSLLAELVWICLTVKEPIKPEARDLQEDESTV